MDLDFTLSFLSKYNKLYYYYLILLGLYATKNSCLTICLNRPCLMYNNPWVQNRQAKHSTTKQYNRIPAKKAFTSDVIRTMLSYLEIFGKIRFKT